jgi:hypothetical protein
VTEKLQLCSQATCTSRSLPSFVPIGKMTTCRCEACGLDKLPSDFLDVDLTPSCHRHFRSSCLHCTLEHADKTNSCIECKALVNAEHLELLRSRLLMLTVALPKESRAEGNYIFVTRMDGSRSMFSFHPELTVRDLKLQIQQTTQIDASKFRLLFRRGNKELYVSLLYKINMHEPACQNLFHVECSGEHSMHFASMSSIV